MSVDTAADAVGVGRDDVAGDETVAERDGGGKNVQPAAGIVERESVPALQPGRVPAGDFQPVERRRHRAGDDYAPPQPLCVHDGRIGGRVADGEIAVPAAEERQVFGDVDYLGYAGPLPNAGVSALGDVDFVAGGGGIYGFLDGGVAGGRRTAAS